MCRRLPLIDEGTEDDDGAGRGWREASCRAPGLWRFRLRTGSKSGRGLPQSKTLRARAPNRHFPVSRHAPPSWRSTNDENGRWHWGRAAFPGCRFWRLSSRQSRRDGRLESLPNRQTRMSALQAAPATRAIFRSDNMPRRVAPQTVKMERGRARTPLRAAANDENGTGSRWLARSVWSAGFSRFHLHWPPKGGTPN